MRQPARLLPLAAASWHSGPHETHRRLLALLLVLVAALDAHAQTALRLRWELKGDVFTGTPPSGAPLARPSRSPTPTPGRSRPRAGRLTSTRSSAWYSRQRNGRHRHRTDPGRVLPPGAGAVVRGSRARQDRGVRGLHQPDWQHHAGAGRTLHRVRREPHEGIRHPRLHGEALRAAGPAGRARRAWSRRRRSARSKNAASRDLPIDALPLVLPTPLRVENGPEGTLRLTGAPRISAPPELGDEQSLATAWLSKPFAKARPTTRRRSRSCWERWRVSVPRKPTTWPSLRRHPHHREFACRRVLRPAVAPQSFAAGGRGRGAACCPRSTSQTPRVSVPRPDHGRLPQLPAQGHVFRVLDLMARYKLNTLHFHLTEDEGWRSIFRACPNSPRWAPGGDTRSIRPPAFRRHTGPGPDVDHPLGSGFYSRSDYIEILSTRRHGISRSFPRSKCPATPAPPSRPWKPVSGG